MAELMTGVHDPVCVVGGAVNENLVLELPKLPRPGETVGAGRFHSGPGGKGANQAVVAAGLGAKVYFVGRIGQDEAGVAARGELRRAGVDDSFLSVDPKEPTGRAVVLVGSGGENLIGGSAGGQAGLRGPPGRRAPLVVARRTPRGGFLSSPEG